MPDTSSDMRKRLRAVEAKVNSVHDSMLDAAEDASTDWVMLRQQLESALDQLQSVTDWVDERLR